MADCRHVVTRTHKADGVATTTCFNCGALLSQRRITAAPDTTKPTTLGDFS